MRRFRGALGVMAAGWLLSFPAHAEDFGSDRFDIEEVTTSSVDGRERYAPKNAVDGRPDTAWLVPNRGSGEWLEVHFRGRAEIAEVGIIPGYDKRRDDDYGDRWYKNNRVRTLLIRWDGGEKRVELRDDRVMQWVEIPPIEVEWIRLEIISVRAGVRWNDTAMAEVAFRRPPSPDEAANAILPPDDDTLDVPTEPSSSTVATVDDTLPDEPAQPPNLRSVTVWMASLGVLGLAFVGAKRRRLWRTALRQHDAWVERAREAVRTIKQDTRKLGEHYAPVASACVDLLGSAEQIGEQCAATQTALSRTRGLSSAGAVARRERLEAQETRVRSRLLRIVDQLEDVAALLATIPRDHLDHHDVDAMIQRLQQEVLFVDAAEEELQCN